MGLMYSIEEIKNIVYRDTGKKARLVEPFESLYKDGLKINDYGSIDNFIYSGSTEDDLNRYITWPTNITRVMVFTPTAATATTVAIRSRIGMIMVNTTFSHLPAFDRDWETL